MVADAPDLLNIFPLQRSLSLLPNFSQKTLVFLASLGLLGDVNISPSADGSSASSGVLYDPLLSLNLSPQPPLLRELFHSLPHDGGVYSLDGGLLTNGVDERKPIVGPVCTKTMLIMSTSSTRQKSVVKIKTKSKTRSISQRKSTRE